MQHNGVSMASPSRVYRIQGKSINIKTGARTSLLQLSRSIILPPLARRSSCSPALLYPPPRLLSFYPQENYKRPLDKKIKIDSIFKPKFRLLNLQNPFIHLKNCGFSCDSTGYTFTPRRSSITFATGAGSEVFCIENSSVSRTSILTTEVSVFIASR